MIICSSRRTTCLQYTFSVFGRKHENVFFTKSPLHPTKKCAQKKISARLEPLRNALRIRLCLLLLSASCCHPVCKLRPCPLCSGFSPVREWGRGLEKAPDFRGSDDDKTAFGKERQERHFFVTHRSVFGEAGQPSGPPAIRGKIGGHFRASLGNVRCKSPLLLSPAYVCLVLRFYRRNRGEMEEILSISRNAIRSHSGIKVLSLASLPPTPLGSSNRPTTTSTLDKEKGISLFPLFLLLEPRNQYLPSPLPFIQRCPLLLNWPGGLELTEIPLLRGGGIGQADEKLIQVAEKRRHRRVSKRGEERPKVHRFPFFLFFKSVVVIIFFVVSWYVPSSLLPSADRPWRWASSSFSDAHIPRLLFFFNRAD